MFKNQKWSTDYSYWMWDTRHISIKLCILHTRNSPHSISIIRSLFYNSIWDTVLRGHVQNRREISIRRAACQTAKWPRGWFGEYPTEINFHLIPGPCLSLPRSVGDIMTKIIDRIIRWFMAQSVSQFPVFSASDLLATPPLPGYTNEVDGWIGGQVRQRAR